MMCRGLSQPWSEKRNFSPDLSSKCRLQPPFPLSPKLLVAPTGCAPRPDVSSSCHRAALQVKFSTAPLASMMKFPAAMDERVLDDTS